MQAFPETAAGTLVLGGKVLVLEVALIPEPSVHASYAESAEGRDSPAIDAFFSRLVSDVSKGRYGHRLHDALGYLMRLDELSVHEGNEGARWFGEVDVLAKELARFTRAQAGFLAQCVPLSLPTCQLPFHFRHLQSSKFVRTNEFMLNPTGLRDIHLFLLMFSFSVVML